MKNLRRYLPIAALLGSCALGAMMLAGCGGGGGSASNTSTMGVYVTDDFGDQFSQVWVTLYRIEASTNGTTFQTIYENADGKTINISRLANSAEFLGALSLPNTAFTKVRVTIADHIMLVPKAGGSAQSVPVDSSIPSSGGKSMITFDVTNPGSHHDLVVDFDLAAFQLMGGKVVPHLKHGDDDTFHHDEKHADLEGIVSNLSSTGFDLTMGGGRVVTVQTNADTVIFSAHLGTSAALANGQRVVVKGSVDPDTHIVLASWVKINDNNGHHDDHHHDLANAEGTVESIDAANKSFVLTLTEAEDFTPTGGTVIVQTNDTTVFEKMHHVAAAFSDIQVHSGIEAAGTYDDTTNTLTATRVRIR